MSHGETADAAVKEAVRARASAKKDTHNHRGRFILLCAGVFVASFVASAAFKLTYNPNADLASVDWGDDVGTLHADIPYGDGEAQKLDIYVPADAGKPSYGIVVYLHSGGFTTGDKSDDDRMLEWLCSKGYVAVGINYTLAGDAHPDANVYTQSVEVRDAVPVAVQAAEDLGYHVDRMAMAGGSAGGCLALLYAYRDADQAPVPVRMVFEGVGPSSFYPEDWTNYGFDKDAVAACAMFSYMSGNTITPDMIGTPAYDDAIRDISALLWVDRDTVPTVMAYGRYDTFQPYLGSVRLDAALTAAGVEHEYIVFDHSGHGLQNDDDKGREYLQAINEYLDRYMS